MSKLLLLSFLLVVPMLICCSAPQQIDVYDFKPEAAVDDGRPERFRTAPSKDKADLYVSVFSGFPDREVSFDLSVREGSVTHKLWQAAVIERGVDLVASNGNPPESAARMLIARMNAGSYTFLLRFNGKVTEHAFTLKHPGAWYLAALTPEGVEFELFEE